MKENFCVLPWIHSFVNHGGEYEVCCTSEGFHNGIVDEQGRQLNVRDGVPVEDVMNTPFMRQIRRMMLKGKWHPTCTRCRMVEAHGGVSRRMVENGAYADLADQLIETTAPDGAIPVRIASADYRLGNLCNLQCRMCSPNSSDRWLKDWNSVKSPVEAVTPEQLERYRSYDWIDDPVLLREFEAKAKGLRHLHFAGGEPLIMPQMRKILQKCIELDVASSITLTYNTNITKLPEDTIRLWSQFRCVNLLCSIDGFGPLNDYIRINSRWETIDRNLRTLDARASELHIGEILVSTTVQAYNVLYLDRLVDYLQDGAFQVVVPFPNLVDLLGPMYLRTQVLPKHLKKLAAEKLTATAERARAHLPEHKTYLLENAAQVTRFMEAEDHSKLMGELLSYSERVDRLKKQSLREVCPDLTAL